MVVERMGGLLYKPEQHTRNGVNINGALGPNPFKLFMFVNNRHQRVSDGKRHVTLADLI